MKKKLLSLFPVLLLIPLLLYPSLSFEGAKKGLLLWFNIVLPTLLPFMLCTGLVVAWNGTAYLTAPFHALFQALRLSGESGYAWLCGLLCGYPVGAKMAADFVKAGRMTKQEGNRILAIAACPSPMFLAGYIKSCLPAGTSLPLAAAALYLPLFGFALLTAFDKNRKEQPKPDTPLPPAREPFLPFDEILMSSLETMVKIGGYIMMFSILGLFAEQLTRDSTAQQALFMGMIEMTTGIQVLSSVLTGKTAAAAIMACAAFGGICGIFQTKTVIKNAGLSIRHYVFWKLLHAVWTGTLLILLL